MSLTADRVLEALTVVQDPDLRRDLVALGMIEDVRIDGGRVSFTVALTTPACPVKDDLKRQCEEAVAALPGVTEVVVTMTSRVRGRAAGTSGKVPIPGVAHVVAVASGKGGVGKSTVAVNLAVALAQDGARVGLIDADVYGPNVPLMLGVREQPYQKDGKIIPLAAHGVKVMSMGFLVDPETPVIWRGPMLHGVMQNFTRDVDRGTGDVQLSLAQQVPLAGAVIVATPQQVALDDAQKAIAMFQKLEVPVLGMIENMSYFTCPSCDARHEIFSSGGAAAKAQALGLPFLGAIPIHPSVRQAGDAGAPVLVTAPGSPEAESFRAVARQVAARLSIQAEGGVPALASS